MKHIVLGTAGHIDHGKTSLVQALTGVQTDRLSEERRRGITIELGFAPIALGDDLRASIVDVPGHERLVRTMVAGAGGIDIGILVVAADDGVMPQTREHLDILRLLGVPAGITVITKADLADQDLLDFVTEDIRETIADSVFADQPIMAVSSTTGAGIDELRALLHTMGQDVDHRSDEGPGFLPLDRVFTKEGYGTIGTGTTLRGTFSTGDLVTVLGDTSLPVAELKVRGLQALGSSQDSVVAGMRTAINLAGKGTERVTRGMTVGKADAFLMAESVIAWLEVLPQATTLKEETVTTHLGTTERETRLIPLGGEKLEPGEAGAVLLRFDRPIPAYAGQRLVLRRPGVHGQATIAGGEILDPEPPRGKGSVSLAASAVEALRGNAKERLRALAKESRAAGINRDAIIRRLPPGEARRSAEFLEKKGHLLRMPGQEERWVDGELIATLVHQIVSRVNAYHDDHPMAEGMPEAELGTQLAPPERHLAPLVADRAVAQKKLIRAQTVVAIPGRGSAVSDEDNAEMLKIADIFDEAALTPPATSQLQETLSLDTRRLGQLLGFMRRSGKIIKVSTEQHYSAESLKSLRLRLIDSLATSDDLSASDFKDIAGGISRKYAIPLLEYFDREKVTMRVGNLRKLHPSQRQEASN